MIKCKSLNEEIVMLLYFHLEKRTMRRIINRINNKTLIHKYVEHYQSLTESRELYISIDDIDYLNKFEIFKNDKEYSDLALIYSKIKSFKINLPYNIGLKSAKSFNKTIVNCYNLTSLILCFGIYYSDGIGIKVLNELLKSAINVTYLRLYLNSNKITDNSVKVLSESLSKITNLIDILIRLDINKITDSGCFYLSDSLYLLNQLSSLHLNLNYNNIGVDAVNYLIDKLSQIKSLKCLNLQIESNKISEKEKLLLSYKFINTFSKSMKFTIDFRI